MTAMQMNGDIITIRPETGNDFGEISEVVRLAFRDMPDAFLLE